MTISWDVTEIDHLAADIAGAAVRIGAPVAAVVRKSAAAIERDAKAYAPVLTGALRDSITTTLTGDGRSASMTAEIGPTADYGEFVEDGTSVMAPERFMTPAFEKEMPAFISGLEQAAGEIL